MADKSITISVEQEVYNLLVSRAKKSMMDIDELLEDIIRRSMLSYKKTSRPEDKTDDSLVALFSRRSRGKQRR